MFNNLIGINYSEIFNSLLKDQKVRSMMGDFIVFCVDNCVEMEDALADLITKSDKIKSAIDKRFTDIAKEAELKDRITKRNASDQI